MSLFILIGIGAVFSISGFGSIFQKNAKAQTTCDVAANLISQTQSELTLFNLINTYRAENNLPALTWSSSLSKAAAWHANDMLSNNYFSHTDSLGRDAGTRLTQCGYNWSAYGENIFPSSADPQAAFDSWKNSAPHNTAMLNSAYAQAGIANQGNYWTLDLGTGTGSVVDPPVTQVQNPSPTNTAPSGSPTISPTRTPSPTPTPSIILNPTNTKIRVSIRLAGIGKGGNENPKNLTRYVTIEIFDQDNKSVVSGNGFLKYNGSDGFSGDINLGQIPDGVYYVKVRGLATLTALVVPEFQSLNSDRLNVLPQVFLVQGDLDEDNAITIIDFNIALICFQYKVCESIVDVDFNDDGKEDVVDYNIFLSSFKRADGD